MVDANADADADADAGFGRLLLYWHRQFHSRGHAAEGLVVELPDSEWRPLTFMCAELQKTNQIYILASQSKKQILGSVENPSLEDISIDARKRTSRPL